MKRALSKAQLRAVATIQAGGHIWLATGEPYIYDPTAKDGPRSLKLNRGTFSALVKAKVIKKGEHDRWLMAS